MIEMSIQFSLYRTYYFCLYKKRNSTYIIFF